MRLLIVGTLKGQLTTATKIAMDNGASVTHAEDNEQAMRVLRGGKGADLLLVDVSLDIRDLVMRLEASTARPHRRIIVATARPLGRDDNANANRLRLRLAMS